MKHSFIVLEGLSGVGKTTIGRLLSERLGARLYVTPPGPYREAREAIDAAGHLRARYLFYLSGLYHASRDIQRLRCLQPVVCDRYALSTECFHRAAGLTVPFCHLDLDREEPSLQVLVTAPEPRRTRRLELRGLSVNDRWERTGGLEDRLLAAYRQHDLIEVDNASHDPADAVEALVAILSAGVMRRPRRCLQPRLRRPRARVELTPVTFNPSEYDETLFVGLLQMFGTPVGDPSS